MGYLKQIDSFRFFAALAVLMSHWLHNVPLIESLGLGFIGVDFFFVISGFLISFQLYKLKDSVDVKKISKAKGYLNFILRRAFRIFPLYYFVLILATVFNKGEIRDAFFYNLSYMSNFYFIKVQNWNGIFSHFWSLAVEEHFYLFWPLIIILLRKKSVPIILITLSLFSLFFRLFIFSKSPDYFSVHIHTLSCIDVFMFGAALAYFYKNKNTAFLQFFSNKRNRWLILLALFIVYGLFITQNDWVYFNWVYFRTLFGIFSAGLLGLLVIGFKGFAGKIFENPLLIRGGKWSYAIYLLHNFIPGMLLEIKKFNLHIGIRFIIYLAVTIILSGLLHKFIENPIRKIGKRFKIA